MGQSCFARGRLSSSSVVVCNVAVVVWLSLYRTVASTADPTQTLPKNAVRGLPSPHALCKYLTLRQLNIDRNNGPTLMALCRPSVLVRCRGLYSV